MQQQLFMLNEEQTERCYTPVVSIIQQDWKLLLPNSSEWTNVDGMWGWRNVGMTTKGTETDKGNYGIFTRASKVGGYHGPVVSLLVGKLSIGINFDVRIDRLVALKHMFFFISAIPFLSLTCLDRM